jgi:hypothetical protein
MRAMPTVDAGATLTPSFREFLPVWVAAQQWYAGGSQDGRATIRPVGYYRLEDQAGAVGIETHLVSAAAAGSEGSRADASGAEASEAGVSGAGVSGAGVSGAGVSGAGVSGAGVSGAGVSPADASRAERVVYQIPMTYRDAPLPGAEDHLIATAEHSVLGPRWIYDATVDPVWVAELVRLVATGGTAARAGGQGIGTTEVRGYPLPGASALAASLFAAGPSTASPSTASPSTGGPGTGDLGTDGASLGASIEVRRALAAGEPPSGPEVLGLLLGSWQPDGAAGGTEHGCLAVVRVTTTASDQGHAP